MFEFEILYVKKLIWDEIAWRIREYGFYMKLWNKLQFEIVMYRMWMEYELKITEDFYLHFMREWIW